jgi:hypothetical protein
LEEVASHLVQAALDFLEVLLLDSLDMAHMAQVLVDLELRHGADILLVRDFLQINFHLQACQWDSLASNNIQGSPKRKIISQ